MRQFTTQLHHTTGRNISDQINSILIDPDYKGFRVMNVLPIPIAKIGGSDYEYIVVFESDKD